MASSVFRCNDPWKASTCTEFQDTKTAVNLRVYVKI
jgi:hypothetical protein